MRFAFRTDASIQIGSGHVIRCLTLADALREQGAECQFICRDHESHMMSLIERRDYPVKILPAQTNTFKPAAKPAHAAWLGCDWKADAEQTRQAIGAGVVDWLIVDHYALDRRWHQTLRPSAKCLMVIDDLADRPLDCDLLLDQNYGSSPSRYAGLVPLHCLQLHGPEYALLKPVYAERRAKMRKRTGAIHRVLIYFGGGADHAGLTGQAVRAFDRPELADIHLDVVVSAAYAHLSSLQAFAAQRGNVSLHSQLPDLADLMAQADLAIGAGGATTWERCCMGLPTIVTSIAENQKTISKKLSDQGIIDSVEIDIVSDISRFTAKISELINSKSALLDLSEKSKAVTDGFGVNRVINKITACERYV
jgi:UDP-2,4-diacetamido-2,4,6-trideoxy-beta-L-altropyranose hydrolase